jgi:hypothetical protein
MIMEEIYMDVPAVRNMAQGFANISGTLFEVVGKLEMSLHIINNIAFIGLVGDRGLARFLNTTKPRIERIAAKCAELSSDLNAAVDAYERGDQIGATRFY